MSDTGSQFVKDIERLKSLNSRYEKLKCVNLNGTSKKGTFSYIFKAFDTHLNDHVAIKFFDPEKTNDTYRLRSFERESEILERLLEVSRCLQLVEGHNVHTWVIKSPGGDLNIGIPYFVTEWLESDIERFAYEQERIEAAAKIRVFKDIVLAVSALHRKEVSHRDLKLDNFRLKCEGDGDYVVAIDLGTAVHLESESILDSYEGFFAGHGAYSSLEALCGFAGDRELAFKNDVYALGCILFEIFNVHQYFKVVAPSIKLETTVVAMRAEMTAMKGLSIEKQKKGWEKRMRLFSRRIVPPTILQDGNTVPACLGQILTDLHSQLVAWSCFERKVTMKGVLNALNTCERVLNNEKRQKKLIEQRKKVRERKIAKAKAREIKALRSKYAEKKDA
ncbi:protein kinase family protein [Alteromonas macleodii]|uniref:protein kinase family protein n=1 Tax=Alteromonas macleodii TaxID=28108 RepID=UPI003140532B